LKHSQIQVRDNDETRIAMTAVARVENLRAREYYEDSISIADVRELYGDGVDVPLTPRARQVQRCVEELGMNFAQTARELDCTKQAIGYIARKYGLVPKKKKK